MTSEIKVDTISENTSANGVTIDGLTIKDGNIIGDVALAGTTPTFTIGDAGAEDAALIFDGNAQDFYIALDDSADDLIIGLGAAVGTTPMLSFTEAKAAAFTGVVTANAGVVVDELTIDADTITATDDFIIDAAGDITLDADGDNIRLNYGGTQIGQFKHVSSNLEIHTTVNNEDMVFKGVDNNSEITALTLDMSEAGKATFNQGIVAAGSTAGGYGLILNSASGDNVALTVLDTGSGGAANATLNTSDGSLILSTAGTERMRITSGGLAIGGTGAANTLDDYEEGTWTPTNLNGSNAVATTHKAIYVKIGNIVHVFCDITYASSPADTSQANALSGIPFSCSDDYFMCGSKFAGVNESVQANVASTSAVFRNMDDGVLMTRSQLASNRAQHYFTYTIS